MRYYFTLFVFFTCLNSFGQSETILQSLSDTVVSETPSSLPKPWQKIGTVIKTNYIQGRASILDDPSQEIKILTRSAIVISSVSAAGIVTYAFGDKHLRDFTLANRNQFTSKISGYIEPLGRSSMMFFGAGGFYATGLALSDTKLQRAGILVASSLAINDLVTGQLKDEFQRRRPDIASKNHHFEGGEGGRNHASFPSSHTSTAFAFAASVATVYKDNSWVPPISYGLATLVGLSRIHDNQHWATDVMAGAAVGIITAKTTNIILKLTEKQLAKKKIKIYVTPKLSSGTLGLHAGGVF